MDKHTLKARFTKWVKSEDHVEYFIKIMSTKDDTLNVDFTERYSTLRDLYDILRKEANTSKFPKFPPKKYFGNTDEKFLNQRMAALDHYFSQVFEDFAHLASFKKWVDDKIAKYSKKVNTKEVSSKEVLSTAPKVNKQVDNNVDIKKTKKNEDVKIEKKNGKLLF